MAEDLNTKVTAYYKLKQKYDDKIQRQKMRILRDPALSVKEKRARVRLIKKQCINCKKDGGMEFSSSDNMLRATCGNKTDPCDLNIAIRRGDFADIRTLKATFKEEIENGKASIIRTKLDLLFNYLDEASSLEKFQKQREELAQYSKPLELLSARYLDIVNNVANQREIEGLDAQLFILTEELDTLVSRFHDDPQPALVGDMVELYISRLLPIVTKIRELKYSKVGISKTDGDTIRLVEEPYTLEDLLVNLDTI